jgi:hypothetical protein
MVTLSHVFDPESPTRVSLCGVPRRVTRPTSEDSIPCPWCVHFSSLTKPSYARALKERKARSNEPPTLVCDWCGKNRTELMYLQHWPGHRDADGRYRDPLVCETCRIKKLGSAEPPEENT